MDWMAGTLSPEQMAQQNRQQQALVEALRQASTFDPNNAGGQQLVQSSGAAGGDNTAGGADALGGMLGKGLGYGVDNIATANRYGTNVGSQQTGMLQAQDAGMF